MVVCASDASHRRSSGVPSSRSHHVNNCPFSSVRGWGRSRVRRQRRPPTWARRIWKAAPSPPRATSSREHPRVRGEQMTQTGGRRPFGGPSPRARGAGAAHQLSDTLRGTIPACAGSSRCARVPCSWLRDHPRVRGEQFNTAAAGIGAGGPSPRARGAAETEFEMIEEIGTIPACAGSSRSSRTTRSRTWDHPRVRGEQSHHASCSVADRGPSPRARGADSMTCSFIGGGTRFCTLSLIPALRTSHPSPN